VCEEPDLFLVRTSDGFFASRLETSCAWEVAVSAVGSRIGLLAYIFDEDGVSDRVPHVKSLDGTTVATVHITAWVDFVGTIEMSGQYVILNHGRDGFADMVDIVTGDTRALVLAGPARLGSRSPNSTLCRP